jgi:hypothetical protein
MYNSLNSHRAPVVDIAAVLAGYRHRDIDTCAGTLGIAIEAASGFGFSDIENDGFELVVRV